LLAGPKRRFFSEFQTACGEAHFYPSPKSFSTKDFCTTQPAQLRRLLVDRGRADDYTGGMTDKGSTDCEERPDQPGKIRTWWHPLLARLLDHALATGYRVLEEVVVGKLPLRLDILLIRREAGQLLAARRRDVDLLLPLLNRFTLIQFKGPTDALQRGDLAQLVGCALLWHGQQDERISNRDISLLVLAPTVNEAARDELQLLGCQLEAPEPGICQVSGLQFAAWFVETDVMAERGQPLLSLVSRVFLRDRERIIEQLTHTGHVDLLCYMLQQVQQFRRFGEDFAMQHKDSEYLGEVETELRAAVLEAIPPEERLRGLPPEERLRGLPPEERLRGLPPEERLRGVSFDELILNLSEDQVAQLREALERRPGQKP
jgi:hypothetical protein